MMPPDLAAAAAVPTAGNGLVDLGLLAIGGEPAARDKFERLVQAIVGEIYSTAKGIRPNPGDWGIDTYVGQLSAGTIGVWQAKYFRTEIGQSQKAQIRESFTSLRDHAARKGFVADSWILAVPCQLSGDETQWWVRWAKKQQRETGVTISLWDGPHIERLLLKPDLAPIRQQFFGRAPGEPVAARPITEPPDPAEFDDALFVAQLRAANISVDKPARLAFFNADALARDVEAREVPGELQALSNLSHTLHAKWHTKFEEARALSDGTTNQLPLLYPNVMSDVAVFHRDEPSLELRDTLVHRLGLVHHLVDRGDAGWVDDFETVRNRHWGAGDE